MLFRYTRTDFILNEWLRNSRRSKLIHGPAHRRGLIVVVLVLAAWMLELIVRHRSVLLPLVALEALGVRVRILRSSALLEDVGCVR